MVVMGRAQEDEMEVSLVGVVIGCLKVEGVSESSFRIQMLSSERMVIYRMEVGGEVKKVESVCLSIVEWVDQVL